MRKAKTRVVSLRVCYEKSKMMLLNLFKFSQIDYKNKRNLQNNSLLRCIAQVEAYSILRPGGSQCVQTVPSISQIQKYIEMKTGTIKPRCKLESA